jgi:hypothetical protein
MELKIIYDEFIQSDFFKEVKEFFLKHPIGIIIFLAFLVWIINSEIWTTLDGVFTFGTLFAVLVNIYIEAQNKAKELVQIQIILIIKSTNQEIIIDKNLTRKDCQRSEIQGILRTKLIKGRNFYDIDYIGTDSYFENIYQIQIAKESKLKIYLEDDELKQFGLE